MKILLLHPEDDFHGPWTCEPWDLVVDLGRAPKSFYDEHARSLGCAVLSIFDLALEVEDLRVWRGLLELGMGRVMDRFGIDWWDVISLLLQREMQDLRLVRRLAERIRSCQRLAVSRPSKLAEGLSLQLGCPLQVLGTGQHRRLLEKMNRYGRTAASLSLEQIRQVIYDKYDWRYAWRRRFAGTAFQSPEPVVLLPSAYANVTRTAFRYAAILPQQQFLTVLAREIGAVSPVPENVQSAPLAAFAPGQLDRNELRGLEEAWDRLESYLRDHPDFQLSVRLKVLQNGKRWLRWGVAVRDAWNAVFERRSVIGCLSADDSNPYTRIPLILACQRNIPAVACHHGALDGVMAYKNPTFSAYLVKGEMEFDYLQRVCGVDGNRLQIGASAPSPQNQSVWSDRSPWIVLFTEPYEAELWRTEAVYQNLLPRLCATARRAGKSVVMKLHPFESPRQRQRMLRRVLSEQDRRLVSVSGAPLSGEILRNTWCAVTVESTTAVECATAGIPVFLCGWLRHAYIGYAQQYVHFGVAQMIEAPDDLLNLPEMVKAAIPAADLGDRLVRAIRPEHLAEILCHPYSSALR